VESGTELAARLTSIIRGPSQREQAGGGGEGAEASCGKTAPGSVKYGEVRGFGVKK